MKTLLVFTFLLAGVVSAGAQQAVYETAQGSGTVTSVAITSTTLVQLDSSTRIQTNRFVLEIWNDDASANLFCGFTAATSSTTAVGQYGRRVGPRASWALAMPNSVPIYCASDSATVRAVLTQLW